MISFTSLTNGLLAQWQSKRLLIVRFRVRLSGSPPGSAREECAYIRRTIFAGVLFALHYLASFHPTICSLTCFWLSYTVVYK